MNIIDLCINFVVLYSISIFLWVVISIMAILIYITEDIKQDGIAKTLYFDTLKVANNTFLSLGKMPFFLITILFLIYFVHIMLELNNFYIFPGVFSLFSVVTFKNRYICNFIGISWVFVAVYITNFI